MLKETFWRNSVFIPALSLAGLLVLTPYSSLSHAAEDYETSGKEPLVAVPDGKGRNADEPGEKSSFPLNLSITGRVQVGWKITGGDQSGLAEGYQPEHAGFAVPRWRLGVQAEVFEHVWVKVTIGESERRREHNVNLLDAVIHLTYFDFANLIDSFRLQVMLNLGESEGWAKIIANPRITTSDNIAATIKSGTQIPYQVESDEGISYEFKDATISLDVTPHITNDDYIQMKITANKDAPDRSMSPPGIIKNEASTEILVDNGDTFVIGGLNQMLLRTSKGRGI